MDENSTSSDPKYEWEHFNNKNQLVLDILPETGVDILKTSSALRRRKYMEDNKKLTYDG